MIDNSLSMDDKQAALAEAVPVLLSRLITPLCLDDMGNAVPRQNGQCPSGTTQEFTPVDDIHIGVITSSLGNHGGDTCTPTPEEPEKDDHGQLLPSVRTGLVSHENLGFLAWKGADGGETDEAKLIGPSPSTSWQSATRDVDSRQRSRPGIVS